MMSTETFEAFRRLVYEKSGIALRPGKESMVSARIGKRMRALGIHEHRDYLRRIRSDDSGGEVMHLLDCIATNVTKFFREGDHFDFLGAAAARWLAEGQRRFRFWSAACSTGEEAYSIAMAFLDRLQGREGIDWRILATDISTRVLAVCRTGIYPGEKLADIPAPFRSRYFDEAAERERLRYRVRDEVRKRVVFSRLNLSEPPFPMKGPFDAVFCRNVMIYFDNAVRLRLLQDIHRLVKPGGFLFVGHAESLTGLMMREFKPVRPSIYVKA